MKLMVLGVSYSSKVTPREISSRTAGHLADSAQAVEEAEFGVDEILLWPRTLAALEAMAPVLELLDAD